MYLQPIAIAALLAFLTYTSAQEEQVQQQVGVSRWNSTDLDPITIPLHFNCNTFVDALRAGRELSKYNITSPRARCEFYAGDGCSEDVLFTTACGENTHQEGLFANVTTVFCFKIASGLPTKC